MKSILKLMLFLILPINLYCHSLVVNIEDNKNNTITINGKFDTGESIAGALLQLKAMDSGEKLYEARFPNNNELTVEIPKIPYQIVLVDESDGDEIVKEGVSPLNGFEKKAQIKTPQKKEAQQSRTSMQLSTSTAVTVSIISAFILLFATIIVSIRNTNKLMNELKK